MFPLEETLQDLIRFLRRDSTSERFVMLQLSAWNIMHKDIIPLMLTYSQDQSLVYHAGKLKKYSFSLPFSLSFIVKLIAFLTLPTEEIATNVQEQNRAHFNHLNALIENEHIFAIVLGLIIEPLRQLESARGASFKNSESKSLQLILTFYRNLLIIVEEESNIRLKKILTSCLLKYGFLDILLILVQNHQKILSYEDTALTIEILQLLYHGIPADKLAEEFINEQHMNHDISSRDNLKFPLQAKKHIPRFSGKFELKSVHHLLEASGKIKKSHFHPVLCSEKLYFLDKSMAQFWSALLDSTYFGAFVYHAWRDILRSSGDIEQRATEWQTRCHNLLLFSTFGLRIVSKLIFHGNASKDKISIKCVSDIFESSFIHWLRMEWIALENKKDYCGANIVCSMLVEITAIIHKVSVHGTSAEKDVCKFLVRELYYKSKTESLLEQACISLKNFKSKYSMAYLFSLIYLLNSSLMIVDMYKSQQGGVHKYGTIHDNSIIYCHTSLLKDRNRNKLVLDSVHTYLRSLMSSNCVEKLFTFRHLDCLHEYSVISRRELEHISKYALALQQDCWFVLNCFHLACTKRTEHPNEKKKLFLEVLLFS